MNFSIIVVLSKGIEGQDRRAVFETCFGGLINQNYPKENYEVVLVDSGSGMSNQVIEKLKEEGSQVGVFVIFIQTNLGNIGPARARNIGLKSISEGRTKFKSEAIVFTDDDTLVGRDWLKKLAEGYKNFPQTSGVGGLTLPDEGVSRKNVFAFYDKFIYSRYPQAVGPSKNINEHPVFSGNISYKREVLEKVGGFDETYPPYIYGEDADLKERVAKSGGFLIFVDAVNRHLASYKWKKFVKQQESRGAGILKFRLNHNLKLPWRLELIIKLLLTPAFFFLYLAKNYQNLKIVILETLAYFFRQIGKIKYYDWVLGRHSAPRAGIHSTRWSDGSQVETGMTSDDDSEDKTKILFVDHTPVIGGAQLALWRHLKYLDKSAFNASVVTSGDYLEFNEQLRRVEDVKSFQIDFPQLKNYNPISSIRFLVTCFNLINIAKNEGSQILVANTERAFYACFLVSLFLNRELILIVRDFEYSKLLLKLTVFKVSKFICVSRKIQSFYGFDSSKSCVVYVGSDIDEQIKVIKDDEEPQLRSSLGLTRDSFVIGFVGRLISWKGTELLLKSFVQLCQRQKNLKLVFVGDGPQNESLQGLAESLGVKEKVFFAGFIKDVAAWYKIFDVFVQASIKDEPFATTIIEAALVGLPIVATNTGGTAEFIEDNVNGLLVAPEEGSLVKGLEALINDENLRLKLAAAVKQKAQKSFTEKQITRRLQEIYAII